MVALTIHRVLDPPTYPTDLCSRDIPLGPGLQLAVVGSTLDVLAPVLTILASYMFLAGCFSLLIFGEN